MKKKPIETSPLIHPDINGLQGPVYLWLKIFDDAQKAGPWKIDYDPLTVTDIYVLGGYIGQKDIQKADIHFRCQTGNASFNWRMLFLLQFPANSYIESI